MDLLVVYEQILKIHNTSNQEESLIYSLPLIKDILNLCKFEEWREYYESYYC
jgi:hypothetical protein